VLRQGNFYWLIAAFSILSIVGPGITLHMIPYLEDKGLSDSQAVAVLSGWSACGAVGAFATGLLIRRLGSRVLLVIGLGMMSGGLFLLLMVSSFTQGLLWSLYMGTVTGGIFNTVYQVIFADYYGRASLGRISSATWPVQLVGNASGPLLAALAYDASGSYTSIFTVFGFLLMASTACAFMARPPSREPAPGSRVTAVGSLDAEPTD
jgi:MFS family permease